MFVVESLTVAGPRESSVERYQPKRTLSRKGCRAIKTFPGEKKPRTVRIPAIRCIITCPSLGFFERNDTIVRAGRNSFSPVQVMAYWVL